MVTMLGPFSGNLSGAGGGPRQDLLDPLTESLEELLGRPLIICLLPIHLY